MTDTIKLIDSIRKVYDDKGFSIKKMENLLREKGKENAVSPTTIGRFFSKSKRSDYNYRYEDTIRPLAEALLDVDTIEQSDDMETQAMKTFVKVKGKMIDSLEKENHELESELTVYERLEVEREQYRKSIEFLKTQIERKDQRIDRLLDSVGKKDEQIIQLNQMVNDLIAQIKKCPFVNKEVEDY